MSEYGATIQRGVAGMPTAFAADFPGGKPCRVSLLLPNTTPYLK
jgi:metal-dependent amidase/aminoacylase/carboxypeptidase family protein